MQSGLYSNPFKPAAKITRGKPKQTPARNLLERLQNRTAGILRFFYNFEVPFDNNLSERDIRIVKVKQKISGSFRSLKGTKYFARIRSYIVTARKQNVDIFEALKSLFNDNAVAHNLIS